MRTLSKEKIQEVLEKHKKWLLDEPGGERANLSGESLCWANFSGESLCWANFSGADFRWANLSRVNLRGADLNGADLRGADLNGAEFSEADLSRATVDYPIACPESGSFIGYKKARGYIVKLQILEDAKRSSSASRKCRCDRAKVVAIENIDGTVADIVSVNSNHDISFVYTIGEVVSVDNFDDNRWNECATGIHFFITRDEAVRYNM